MPKPAYQPSRTGHRMCPFPGCGDTVPFFQFSCFSHWQRLPAPLRERATALWKDYLDGVLTAAELHRARSEVVDEAITGDRTLVDGTRVSCGTDGPSFRVEVCPDCGFTTVLIPIAGQPGLRVAFDPADSDTGRYACVAGAAGPIDKIRPWRPALARLNPHAETCRARQDSRGRVA